MRPNKASKTRLPRIERSEDLELHDDSEHLWAVSYADFLMVLLSFFILFYSTSEEAKDSIIQKIINKTASDVQPPVNPSGRAGLGVAKGLPIEDIQKELEGFNNFVSTDKKVLTLEFEDNLYGSGEVFMPGKYALKLYEILDKISEFKNQTHITFVGFTDTQVLGSHRKVIRSNIDLGSLRASKALQLAHSFGFPLQSMDAKAGVSQGKNTRSLSIEIRANQEEIDTKERGIASVDEDHFVVQVKALKDREKAFALGARLAHYGVIDVQQAIVKEKLWHRLYVGREASLEQAKSLRLQLVRELGDKSLFVKKLNK